MKYKLKDIIKFKPGYAFKTSQMNNKGLNLIKIKSMKDNKIIFDKDTVKIQETESLKDYIIRKNDILMALTGDPINKGSYETWVGRTSRYTYNYNSYLNQRICKLIPNEEIINSDYLYYWLIDYNKTFEIASLCRGSANQANISHKDVGEMSIELPELSEQIKIGNILTNIDNKIIINNQTNDNLLDLIKTLYIEKIKNNNDINFEEKTLDEFCNIFTGKKNANASEENGQFKFFTCAPEPLSINSYIYDGPAVIVAGNGAYTGRTNFYNGKFDLYQRTYGITTNNDYIYLFYAMIYTDLQNDIMGGTHGSAIPYIVMNDIAKFKVKYNKELFDELSQEMKVLLLKIKSNEAQNETLTQLRDTLLPKLMNGEIDLDKIEI